MLEFRRLLESLKKLYINNIYSESENKTNSEEEKIVKQFDLFNQPEAEIDSKTKIFLDSGENPKRPEHCGLYLIKPESIELWKEGDFRTHQREKFIKNEQNAWERYFLSP